MAAARKMLPVFGLLFACLALTGCAQICTCTSQEFLSPSFGRPVAVANSGDVRQVRYQTESNGDEKKNGEEKNGNGEEKDKNNGNGDEKAKGPPQPPKTLLSWNLGGEDEEDEPEPGIEEPLATDRPDFVEASSNVGLGRVQLEMGYTYIQDRDNGTRFCQHSYPEMLLRIGMIADWFELRIGQNFGSALEESAFGRVVGNGAEDLYLGVGLALTEQKGVLPETRLILQARVPTGGDDFTADRFLPGFNYLYGWEIVPDKWSVAGSTQINRVVDDSNHSHTQVAQAVTTGFMWTEKLGSYVETFGLFPSGAVDPGAGPEYYLDGGFFYRITNNFQVDVRAGVGLNRHAADFFAGSGFAVRY